MIPAYYEGREASKAGLSPSDNPHSKDTDLTDHAHTAWLDGFADEAEERALLEMIQPDADEASPIVKLADITEPGFYWVRWSVHHAWSVAYVDRVTDPKHPLYPDFGLSMKAGACNPQTQTLQSTASHIDLIGPIPTPPEYDAVHYTGVS